MQEHRKKTKITFVNVLTAILIATLVWMTFQYFKSSYDTYLLENHIRTFEDRNTKLTDEITKQREDYLYYISDAYLEKYAKSSLGLKNPDEDVIVIKETELAQAEYQNLLDKEWLDENEFSQLTPAERWYLYFFGDITLVQHYMDQSQKLDQQRAKEKEAQNKTEAGEAATSVPASPEITEETKPEEAQAEDTTSEADTANNPDTPAAKAE